MKRAKAVSIVKDGKKVRVKVVAKGQGHLFTPAQVKEARMRFNKAKKRMK